MSAGQIYLAYFLHRFNELGGRIDHPTPVDLHLTRGFSPYQPVELTILHKTSNRTIE